jgi:hypothetical protein
MPRLKFPIPILIAPKVIVQVAEEIMAEVELDRVRIS